MTPDITTTFKELHGMLSQAVLACRAYPAKKPVHTLRTTTRRLEALLQKALEDNPRAKGFRRAAQKTLRQLKKVRKLAGPVRDLDVHRKLAEEIADQVTPRQKPTDRDTVEHEKRQLEQFLKQKRERAAQALQLGLEKREVRLERALERTASELAGLAAAASDPLTTARNWVESSTARIGELNRTNLHDFRKQTKLARYISEMQPPSATAHAFTKKLSGVHDAIGDWHDLALLQEETESVAGKEASMVKILARKESSAFKKALRKAAANRTVNRTG